MTQILPAALSLRVLTSRALLAEAEATEVSLPSLEGYIGILPGHRPLLVALGKGRISYRSAGEEEQFEIAGGYAEVLPDRVTVFTEVSDDEQNT
jgi:F-type H+-transporting ATPase subunit epsilon